MLNMNAFTYRCPNGVNVQGWSSDAVSADTAEKIYISTRCPACSRIHLVDPSTGIFNAPSMRRERRAAAD